MSRLINHCSIGTLLVHRFVPVAVVWTMLVASATTVHAANGQLDYRILATAKTSTMEQELNYAAQSGYRFSKVMGGKTANGGQEVVIAMQKSASSSAENVSSYKLLATTKTSTMQKELQQWADAGYEYLDQTVFETAFGGKEVVVIMERRGVMPTSTSQYRLLATAKTSTMEKELKDAGKDGFLLVGFTVGATAIGGQELVSILRKN
jgi:hypothetical protein